ncbi:MAG: hypothetical protein ACI81T_002618 [Bacteroidia bacterium]|jgi:hypothetical protein
MARKVKIPNHIQKRLAKGEHKRKRNTKDKRRYFLIVCEGEKTEPNYFESLKKHLPKGVLTSCRIDIEGTGRNTLSLVEESIKIKEQLENETSLSIDKIWVVFDRDSFEPDNFNEAINLCKNSLPEIGCAWTNEAFELWYLLHFHFYNTAINREMYQKLIEGNLNPKLGGGYRYQKNSEEMYDLLKNHGNLELAIKFATKLEIEFEGRYDYANHNPCTKVHHLVAELFGLESFLKEE